MSKRQALGAITVNHSHNNVLTNKQGLANKAVASKTGQQYNNENKPPISAAQGAKGVIKSQPSELEFEIFHEEARNVAAVANRNPTQLGVVPNQIASHPIRLKESNKHVNFFLDNYDENEEDELEHKSSSNDEVEEKRTKKDYDDEDEDEEEDEEDEENKENEEEDDEASNASSVASGLEEEGISRLNIAAMIDSTTSMFDSQHQQQQQQLNSSHCELMMDSSSSTQNDEDMMLDDTIKCISMKSTASSLYIEDDEEEEEVEEEENHDSRSQSPTAEDDEETRRRLEAEERDNIMMNFAEFKDEILEYMRALELEQRPKANYMKKQLDINANMRSILIDWLVEVCEEYKLNTETLYLAVNYTDRFLSQMSVLRGKLQLVGTASMYVAAKYEEIIPPDISEFVYITDDTYTKKQVLRMEHLLLKVLDFKMSAPTTNWFLSYFLRFIRQNTSLSHANNADLAQRIEHLSRYLCELTLVDSDTYLSYLPSQIAASAIYLAMHTLGRPWTKQISDICGYGHDLGELRACIQDLHKTMQGALDHAQQAIQEKYKQKKYDMVALIEPPKSLPPHLYL